MGSRGMERSCKARLGAERRGLVWNGCKGQEGLGVEGNGMDRIGRKGL